VIAAPRHGGFVLLLLRDPFLTHFLIGRRSERSRWEKSVIEQGILNGRNRFMFSDKYGHFPVILSSVLPLASEKEINRESKEGKKHRKNRSFSTTFDVLSG
jgi:hypothetical protein